MIVDLGATVLLCQPDYAGLWHIPTPDEEESLCGLPGDTYIYRGPIRDRRTCPICLTRAPAHLEAREDDAEDDGQPAPRRGKPKGKHRRITDLQLRALHRAYTEQGLSCRQLGELVYQQLGYRSARSCGEALYVHFREAGLPLRDRVAAVVAASTRHGLAPKRGPRPGYSAYQRRVLHDQPDRPRCAAVRENYPRKGQPCQRPATRGSDYCPSHDPNRRDAIAAHLAQARARVTPQLREAA